MRKIKNDLVSAHLHDILPFSNEPETPESDNFEASNKSFCLRLGMLDEDATAFCEKNAQKIEFLGIYQIVLDLINTCFTAGKEDSFDAAKQCISLLTLSPDMQQRLHATYLRCEEFLTLWNVFQDHLNSCFGEVDDDGGVANGPTDTWVKTSFCRTDAKYPNISQYLHFVNGTIDDDPVLLDEASLFAPLEREGDSELWFHATSRDSATSIIENGIQPEQCKAHRDFFVQPAFYIGKSWKAALKWAQQYTDPVILVFQVSMNLLISSAKQFKTMQLPAGIGCTQAQNSLWRKWVSTCRSHDGKATALHIKDYSHIRLVVGPVARRPHGIWIPDPRPDWIQLAVRESEFLPRLNRVLFAAVLLPARMEQPSESSNQDNMVV